MSEENTHYLGGMKKADLKTLVDRMAGGWTIREMRGMSKAKIEAIYSVGLEQYRVGGYENAKKVFSLLTMLEHTSSKYWTAFGGACQALGEYQNAIRCYQMASFYDLHNPKPMYYAAECFFKTGDAENAKRALRSLEMFAPKDTPDGIRFRGMGEALMAKVEAA